MRCTRCRKDEGIDRRDELRRGAEIKEVREDVGKLSIVRENVSQV